MQTKQIKKLSNETLGNLYEALFTLLGLWGEIQARRGWVSPSWVIECEILFGTVEAEMVDRAPTIPLPEQ